MWFGQFISSIGSGLTAFALGIYAFNITGTATSYSTIVLLSFLPSVALQPIGGVVTDLMDRKSLMIIGDIGAALGIAFILLMMLSGVSSMWVIYTGVIISSLFLAIQIPTYKTAVTDLLHEEDYSKASGLIQLAQSSRYLISPILAGFLMSIWNIKHVLILDVATFLIAIVSIFAIKKTAAIHTHDTSLKLVFAHLIEGFRYTISHTGLPTLLFIMSLVTFFVGFLQALLGPMILSFADAKTLGIIQSASATGMLVSSLFIGIFSKTKNLIKTLSFSTIIAGIFYALLGTSTNVYFLITVGFVFFCALPFINTSFEVMIRKSIPCNIQGRIWSNIFFITQIGLVIALGIAGPLADYVFKPLLETNGALASSVGKIIGVGPGRGIGLIFILSGITLSIVAFLINHIASIKKLDTTKCEIDCL